jgi:uncharacterized membrane protein AbrB (regulator of aidB expression)
MTIDLKWALPFVLPFAVLFTIRALFFCAGVAWTLEYAHGVIGVSVLLGFISGGVAAIIMDTEGVYWLLRIGRKRND